MTLIRLAYRGDPAGLPLVKEMVKRPEFVENFGGNFARNIETQLVESLSGDDLVYRECLLKKMETLRKELEGDKPTAIERLLAERCVACWLHTSYADMLSFRTRETRASEEYQKRQDSAHKRYLAALRTLATVRKLALPAIQVNLAKQQVVMGGGGG